MKKLRKGLLITFEGSEGCGKSTQILRLSRSLRKKGLCVLSTREPGGTLISERIRHLLKFIKGGEKMTPEAELLLFEASRAQLVREVVLPFLKKGGVVLCDRFMDSTTVYQGVARRLNPKWIAQLNDFATDGLRPHLTFVLDLDVQTGLARARRKTSLADRMESQKLNFYRAVRRGFKELAQKNRKRVKLIDASRSIAEVQKSILLKVEELLCEG